MLRSLLLGLAVCSGCAKLNPAYGDGFEEGPTVADAGSASEGQTSAATTSGDAASGSGAESATSQTGGNDQTGADSDPGSETTELDPDLVCEEPSFDIQLFSADDLPCNMSAGPDLRQCVVVHSVGGVVTAQLASGCIGGPCVPSAADDELEIEIADTNLDSLYADDTCVTLDAWGEPDQDGQCVWNALFLWSAGGLDVAVGNAMRDLGEVTDTSLPSGGPFTWDTRVDEPSTCGQENGCPTSGWRAVTLGGSTEWASPDGEPVETTVAGEELLLFNWGLGIDLSCERHGRWAIVRPEHLDVFD